ncbi:MAG: YgiT-type zinc finger protein [Ignavibacteriales bacterium]|nr:YgiT-type zinc finger protein [Ignavibacteriales bacterium]
MDKPCTFCGNNSFRQTTVQYSYENEKYSLVVDEVPCEQCEYCNETYYLPDAVKKIQQAFIDKHFRIKRKKKG